MPVVEVKIMENVFTHEEKQRLIEGLSEKLVELTGEWARPYTYTFITEAPNGEFAIAGAAKTADEINAMRHAQPVG
ncbi:tautomerase family protein [Streptomyces sp. NPDC002851]